MAKIKSSARRKKEALPPALSYRRASTGQPDVLVSAAGKTFAVEYKKTGYILGLIAADNLAAVEAVLQGLPFQSIEQFRKTSGITLDRIKEVAGISDGSYSRRRQTGRLSQEESERLLRVGRVFERATELYDGDRDAARRWLESVIPELGNQRPLDLARTEPGARGRGFDRTD